MLKWRAQTLFKSIDLIYGLRTLLFEMIPNTFFLLVWNSIQAMYVTIFVNNVLTWMCLTLIWRLKKEMNIISYSTPFIKFRNEDEIWILSIDWCAC